MSGGNVLAGLPQRVSRIPGAYADEAVALFDVYARRNGGRMLGRYQLKAAERRRYVYPEGMTLIVEGVPSGFWVWRETGTSAHLIGPKPRRKAKTSGRRRGTGGARRGHAPTFTGRRAAKRRKAKKMPGRLGGEGLGHPIAKAVRHPGGSGNRAWSRTVSEVTPKLDASLKLVLGKAVA